MGVRSIKNHADWVIVDTETTGVSHGSYVVELAAQRMSGWSPMGAPFHAFLDHDVDIPWQARMIHSYSRLFLSINGQNPRTVHRGFADYADGAPIVSFNLPFDYDRILIPEWKRLRVRVAGRRGFCALQLARRLSLSRTGRYKLQALREDYDLPERGAHSALGDVNTLVDFMTTVVKPVAQELGVEPFEPLSEFVNGGV